MTPDHRESTLDHREQDWLRYRIHQSQGRRLFILGLAFIGSVSLIAAFPLAILVLYLRGQVGDVVFVVAISISAVAARVAFKALRDGFALIARIVDVRNASPALEFAADRSLVRRIFGKPKNGDGGASLS